VNSVVGHNFNKNFAEKKYLWVSWIVHGIHSFRRKHS